VVVLWCGASIPGSGAALPRNGSPYDADVAAELVPGLLGEVGLPTHLADRVELVGEGQPYATPFPVVECAASVLGCIGAAARRGIAGRARLPLTPGRWEVPTSPIGTHAPAWGPPPAGI